MPAPEKERSGNLNFNPDRDPVEEAESPQAEASDYGIYGYADHPNEPPAGHGEKTDQNELQIPEPPPPGVDKSMGGQDWDDSDHGAGFAQPMEEPQRSASRSPLPDESERGE